MSMEHKALCNSCRFIMDISSDRSRWNLSQESKEVYNQLIRTGFNPEDFCSCLIHGDIRSKVAELDCYQYDKEEGKQ